MNTYPFVGEIKMEKVIKDGKEVIEWEPIPLQSDSFSVDPVTGNVGIGTPPQIKWDASAPLVMGEPVERMRISMTDGVGSTPERGAAVSQQEQDAQKFYNDVKIEVFEVLLSIMKDETNTARDRMQAAKMVDELTLQITKMQRT